MGRLLQCSYHYTSFDLMHNEISWGWEEFISLYVDISPVPKDVFEAAITLD